MNGHDMINSGIHYLIPEDAQTLLERARHALELLAALDTAAALKAGVSADGTAAIAAYVARDVETVLASAREVSLHSSGTP